jgi:enoyl-CoA hydratase
VIRSEERGRVLVLTLDRHERRNALNVAACEALAAAVDAADPSRFRSIVVTGAGSVFCAGADLDEVYGRQFRDALYGMLGAISDHPLPVVAAVNGPAIGAGTQLAIACDLRIATPAATFAVPTARNGLAVDGTTVRRLVALAGGGPARWLLLAAGTLTAERAERLGLVDEIGDLDRALAVAADIAGLAPLAVRYAKLALASVEDPAADPDQLAIAFERCWTSSDLHEARQARAEQRPAEFTGA